MPHESAAQKEARAKRERHNEARRKRRATARTEARLKGTIAPALTPQAVAPLDRFQHEVGRLREVVGDLKTGLAHTAELLRPKPEVQLQRLYRRVRVVIEDAAGVRTSASVFDLEYGRKLALDVIGDLVQTSVQEPAAPGTQTAAPASAS